MSSGQWSEFRVQIQDIRAFAALRTRRDKKALRYSLFEPDPPSSFHSIIAPSMFNWVMRRRSPLSHRRSSALSESSSRSTRRNCSSAASLRRSAPASSCRSADHCPNRSVGREAVARPKVADAPGAFPALHRDGADFDAVDVQTGSAGGTHHGRPESNEQARRDVPSFPNYSAYSHHVLGVSHTVTDASLARWPSNFGFSSR